MTTRSGIGQQRERHDAGFTLIETLAAFAILALVLTVLLGGLSRMATGGRHAESLREALRLAQAKLDGLGIIEPLSPGESAGRFNAGFEWRLSIREMPKSPAVRLVGAWAEITVSATADATRVPSAVSLVTFKLTGAPRQ
jgi:general secretion pathway protein I